MQKNIRFNENQLMYLVGKAKRENSMASYLYKRSSDTGKWQQRYFVLYQNLLFYFENDTATRPSGLALLEGSYCERVITPLKGKESEKQATSEKICLFDILDLKGSSQSDYSYLPRRHKPVAQFYQSARNLIL